MDLILEKTEFESPGNLSSYDTIRKSQIILFAKQRNFY